MNKFVIGGILIAAGIGLWRMNLKNGVQTPILDRFAPAPEAKK